MLILGNTIDKRGKKISEITKLYLYEYGSRK